MSTGKNWDLWGADDQRGALNRLSATSLQRGLASVEAGQAIPLGLPLRRNHGPIFAGREPLQHFMTRDGGDYAAGLPEKGFGYADDYVLIATHGTTHIDALAHVWQDGLMWNGITANEVTSRGAAKCGIEQVGPIVTRAIFVDISCATGTNGPGDEPVGVEALRHAVEQIGVPVETGDALLLRTGWLRRWREDQATVHRWPGLDRDCADWIDDQGFVLVGADNIAVEAGPTSDPTDAAPLHVELMRNRGILLMELLDLEEMASSGSSVGLLIVAPLAIHGAVGSPVNPIVIV